MTKILSKTGRFVQYGQIAISAVLLFIRVADVFIDNENKNKELKTDDTVAE
jgi:hypothetical protein